MANIQIVVPLTVTKIIFKNHRKLQKVILLGKNYDFSYEISKNMQKVVGKIKPYCNGKIRLKILIFIYQ